MIDTNILVSAALNPQGLQRKTLLIAITKPANLYVSQPILAEFASVLSRPQLQIRRGLRLQLLQLIKNHSRLVVPQAQLDICRDPDDNIFVECSEAARADYLITGNKKHFPAFWKKTKIISSREFVSLAAPHLLE